MANSAQARKRARQADKQRAHNASLRSTLRTAIKSVRKAILAGDKVAAQGIFQTSVSIIDRIADKKIVHKNGRAGATYSDKMPMMRSFLLFFGGASAPSAAGFASLATDKKLPGRRA